MVAISGHVFLVTVMAIREAVIRRVGYALIVSTTQSASIVNPAVKDFTAMQPKEDPILACRAPVLLQLTPTILQSVVRHASHSLLFFRHPIKVMRIRKYCLIWKMFSETQVLHLDPFFTSPN